MLMKMIFQHNPHLGKGDEGMVWQRMQQALRVHEAQIAGELSGTEIDLGDVKRNQFRYEITSVFPPPYSRSVAETTATAVCDGTNASSSNGERENGERGTGEGESLQRNSLQHVATRLQGRRRYVSSWGRVDEHRTTPGIR